MVNFTILMYCKLYYIPEPAFTMVWEVVTPMSSVPKCNTSDSGTQCVQTEMMAVDCEEHLPTSDSFIEYDDLPELQRAPDDTPHMYQIESGLSHQQTPPDTQRLTQLALIATGPQSPLLQDSKSSLFSVFSSCDLHSYARPPLSEPSSSLSPSSGCGRERRHSRTSSECGSAVSTRSSLSDEDDMGWNFSWPSTIWHCFMKGTRLRFHSSSNSGWKDIEEVDNTERCGDEEQRGVLKSYGSEGLQLMEHSETVSHDQHVLQLTFNPGPFGHGFLTTHCQLEHPFYVKNKGWSSFHPSLTVVHHGIPCYEMEVGDVCLPPGHRDTKHTDNSLVLDTFRSFSFTPLDSSAVYVLSSMARRRRESQSSSDTVSPDRSTTHGAHRAGPSHSSHHKPMRSQPRDGTGSNTATKSKRPMNAFMLFAKKYRVQYTQMYPGKDNRAISVLLGERWKKMRSEERKVFTVQAKALADEQKRINPDCWKRKRTNSGSQAN